MWVVGGGGGGGGGGVGVLPGNASFLAGDERSFISQCKHTIEYFMWPFCLHPCINSAYTLSPVISRDIVIAGEILCQKVSQLHCTLVTLADQL